MKDDGIFVKKGSDTISIKEDKAVYNMAKTKDKVAFLPLKCYKKNPVLKVKRKLVLRFRFLKTVTTLHDVAF